MPDPPRVGQSKIQGLQRITQPGQYLTRDLRTAIINRIVDGRAFGRIPGDYDRTWWYVNGEHAICPIDDLVAMAGDE